MQYPYMGWKPGCQTRWDRRPLKPRSKARWAAVRWVQHQYKQGHRPSGAPAGGYPRLRRHSACQKAHAACSPLFPRLGLCWQCRRGRPAIHHRQQSFHALAKWTPVVQLVEAARAEEASHSSQSPHPSSSSHLPSPLLFVTGRCVKKKKREYIVPWQSR